MAFEENRSEGMDSPMDDAQASIRNGYSFPPFPDGMEWDKEFRAFTKECSAVLKKRLMDVETVSNSGHSAVRYSDSIIQFNLAIVASDIDLIAIHHRFILDCQEPADIKKCVKVLRALRPDTPASTIFALDHLEARKSIGAAIWASEEITTSTFEATDRLIDDLMSLAFEDISQTSRIVSFIYRGIVEPEDIRVIMRSTAEVNAPLLDGAL